MPMRRITSATESLTGVNWLTIIVTPIAATTDVIASSSGRPAATRAPNVRIRIASVIGNDSSSLRLKSSDICASNALAALASPNCSMRSSGCAR